MRFLFVDERAAAEITGDRVLQSCDFENGLILGEALSNGIFPPELGPRLHFVEQSEGVYALTRERSGNRIVFDLEACPSLFSDFGPAEALLLLQRQLRFAMKLWNNLKLSVCEYIKDGKGVLFPLPLTSKSQFRIVTALEPEFKKTSAAEGKTLVVFRAGTQDKLGARETLDTRTLVRAVSGEAAARGAIERSSPPSDGGAGPAPVRVTVLTELSGHGLDSMGFDQWLHHLTTPQSQFVKRIPVGPERLEGPAGTGKSLCLILRSINTLRENKKADTEYHILLVSHSEPTREAMVRIVNSMGAAEFLADSPSDAAQSLTIQTLHRYCANLLERQIFESEFLDRDAMESKGLQMMYAQEAYEETLARELTAYRGLLSPKFLDFINREKPETVAGMLRHEIGVTIKGRASESWERYRRLDPIKYNLPLKNESDLNFVFSVFNRYKASLETAGQFDTDDVVLSALGQLDTPLWRRRRSRSGFNSIFVDEVHLFNLNELAVFHHLTRSESRHPIVFAIDRSQAVGDRALTGGAISEAMVATGGDTTNVRTVFRCSPSILRIAQTVTASGATVFTNFEDPLNGTSSAFTLEEEKKSEKPAYAAVPAPNLPKAAFDKAAELKKDLGCERSEIALVCFSDDLYRLLKKYAAEERIPIEAVEKRGDQAAVDRARKERRFVVSAPDYVGGLEFGGVVLVGLDELHVPPTEGKATVESKQFVNYAAHNLLYVALTRARYRVEMLGDSSSRPTKLLDAAIHDELVTIEK